ncbi:MAG: hypothetical protein PHX43_03715 [Alphaproteobacteria bacterium]|nr:hypothetical protein [Alphaproteobacteria bacterium]
MNTPTFEDAMPELEALKKFFVTAKQALGNGTITSMVGVDQRISKICQQVQKASPDMQQQYLPELNTLIELLNGYEQALRDFQANQLAEAAKAVSEDAKS